MRKEEILKINEIHGELVFFLEESESIAKLSRSFSKQPTEISIELHRRSGRRVKKLWGELCEMTSKNSKGKKQ